MRAWWSARTRREQILVLIMVAAFALVAYWQALYTPLRALADAAEARYRDAARDAHLITQAAEALHENDAPAANPMSVRARLSEAAASGVRLSRMQPEDGGGMTVWIDPIPPSALFAWIARLSQEGGVAVTRLTVERAGDGRVQAQATFMPEGA